MNGSPVSQESPTVNSENNTASGSKKTKAFLPPDLEPLRSEKVWGVFLRVIKQKKGMNKYTPFLNQKTGMVCRQHSQETLFDYDTMFHICRNYTSSNHRPVGYLSLRFASEVLGKGLYAVDLDKEKDKYKEPQQEYLKNTLINKSPSGIGGHCFLFCEEGNEIPPSVFDAACAVDLQTPEKIVTMTEDWENNNPILDCPDQKPISENRKRLLEAVKKEYGRGGPKCDLVTDGKMSVIYCFNIQIKLEELLASYGYESNGLNWKNPESESGSYGGTIFPSNRGAWPAFYTHHQSDKGCCNSVLDAFDIVCARDYDGNQSKAISKLAKTIPAIDPDTGEVLDITVHEWNEQRKNERKELPEPAFSDSKPIDKRLFPEKVWTAATEVADWTCTYYVNPPIFASISTVSALPGKNVEIHEIDGDLVHPCSIGIIVGEPSGARKTEIYKKMGAPLFEYEEAMQQEWEDESARRKTMATLLENEIKKRTRTVKNNRSMADILASANETTKFQKELDDLKQAKPFLTVEDTTEEKLVRMLNKQNCSIGIFSDDARNVIRNLSGIRRQDGGGENLYLKGFTNGGYVYSRVGADDKFDDIVLRDICLNMFGFAQLDMVRNLVQKGDFVESGMAARIFLFIQNIDIEKMYRNASRRQLDRSKMDPYYKAIKGLCQTPENPVIVRLSEEAGDYWEVFNHNIADLLVGEWEGDHEIINKIGTLSTKIATVFIAMKIDDFFSHKEIEIDLETYKSACEFVIYLMCETLNVHQHIEYSTVIRGARTVSNWLQNQYEESGTVIFKNNAVFRNKQSMPTRPNMSEILEMLEEYGHVVNCDKHYMYVPKQDENG